MITPGDFKSSALVDGFPSEFRVARVPLAELAEQEPGALESMTRGAETYRALPDVERATASAFVGQRKLEHVAGQVAAHIALEALVGARAHAAIIARADDGAPEVRELANAPLISISHGRRVAVAVVGYTRQLGIDLCEHDQAERVRRVAARFIAEASLGERHDQWATLWALKEAAAKALHHGLLDGGLRASRVASLSPPRFAWPALTAAIVRGADDVIAVVYA